MKPTINQIEASCYKLQMMGVPLNGEMNAFCDIESVFKNSTLPESTLKKKHNSIAYHHTCDVQPVKIVHIAWENSESNLADLLTKLLSCDQLNSLLHITEFGSLQAHTQ